MTSIVAMNSLRCARGMYLAAFGVAIFTFGAPTAAQESTVLRLQAQIGQKSERQYSFKMSVTRRLPGTQDQQSSQEVDLFVQTDVLSVALGGRIRQRSELDRLKFATGSGGAIYVIFDSNNPEDVQRARGDPGFDFLFASLETNWVIELEPDGEIWDQEFIVPGSESNSALEPVVSGFLQPLFDMGLYSFPRRAVSPGDEWECGAIDTRAPGGRLEGITECVLEEFRSDGNERTVIVKLKGSVAYRPTPGSGTSAQLTQFDHSGMLVFSLDRGLIKFIRLEGSSTFDIDLDGAIGKMISTNELVIQEGGQ